MKRAIMVAISVLLAVALAAPTVLAQGNGGAPGDVMPPSFDWPAKDPTAPPTDFASVGCNFPLHFELTGKAKTIELPDGGFIFTSPGLDVTVTNVDTGEEATFNIAGTFHETTAANGDVTTKVTGRNLLFDPEAGVVLTIGQFTYVQDEKGNLIQAFEGEGQVIDVCELLS